MQTLYFDYEFDDGFLSEFVDVVTLARLRKRSTINELSTVPKCHPIQITVAPVSVCSLYCHDAFKSAFVSDVCQECLP